MEKTLIQLQETVAHQEQTIASLGDELYAQQQEIAELKQQLAKFETKLVSISSDSNIRNLDEETPPPHY